MNNNILKDLNNNVEKYFSFIDSLLGTNFYNPRSTYTGKFVSIPKSIIEEIQNLLSKNTSSETSVEIPQSTIQIIINSLNKNRFNPQEKSQDQGDFLIPASVLSEILYLLQSNNKLTPFDSVDNINETIANKIIVPQFTLFYISSILQTNIFTPQEFSSVESVTNEIPKGLKDIISNKLGTDNQDTFNSPHSENPTLVESPTPSILFFGNEYEPSNEYSSAGGVQAAIDRAQKIGEYLLSSNGAVFLATQAVFHLANPRTSQILNPLVYPIGGFGIFPDTFDALFVHLKDTTIMSTPDGIIPKGHPGISNLFPGKYGAADQILGTAGFPYPRSGINQIVQTVIDLLLTILNSGQGVRLDETGAVDFSKTPLRDALSQTNYYSTGIDALGDSRYGHQSLGASLAFGDGYGGLIIGVEDPVGGTIKLLIPHTIEESGDWISVKEKDKRASVETVKTHAQLSEIAISKFDPLSPLQYNIYTSEIPQGTNLFRPLKLLLDMGLSVDSKNQLTTELSSDRFFEPKNESKDPKFVSTRKKKTAFEIPQIDPMRAQFEGTDRVMDYDEVVGSYPIEEVEALNQIAGKLYVPLFFEALTIGNRTAFFRAFITSWDQSFSPAWAEDATYGRSQENVVYTNTKRAINLSFITVARHPKELVPMYAKLNWLTRNVYPSFDSAGFINAPPFIRFTLGDLFVGLPVYITNFSVKEVQNGSTWEIEPGAQVPIALEVTLGMGVLHETMPSSAGYYFPLAKYGLGSTPGDSVGGENMFDSRLLSRMRGGV